MLQNLFALIRGDISGVSDSMKKYMVIETFYPGCLEQIYKRFRESGRMLPNGLFYIDSWLEGSGARCFQLMETEDPELFSWWINNWDDLMGFEIIELGDIPQ